MHSWLEQRSCSISLNGITFLQKILHALSRTVINNSLFFKISSASMFFDQPSIKNSISSSLLLELCRYFLICTSMNWFLLLAKYRTYPSATRTVLSRSLSDYWLYWSHTKQVTVAWWYITFLIHDDILQKKIWNITKCFQTCGKLLNKNYGIKYFYSILG